MGAVSDRVKAAKAELEAAMRRPRPTRQYDLGEDLAENGRTELPAKYADEIAQTNAGLPFMSPKPGTARYTPMNLNAAGFTMRSGPQNGKVVVAYGGDSGKPGQVPNTLAHESFHQRVGEHGMRPISVWGQKATPGAMGNGQWSPLRRRMMDLQPEKQFGPHWGLNPSSTPEEQLASIFGYEGSLPKGTAITDTDVGRKLLPDQSSKDYYFSQTAHPYGGLWEGQTENPIGSKMGDAVRQFMQRRGLLQP